MEVEFETPHPFQDDHRTGWIAFFRVAFDTQASATIGPIDEIAALYSDYKDRFFSVLNSQNHDQALDLVSAKPIFCSDAFVKRAHSPEPSARPTL